MHEKGLQECRTNLGSGTVTLIVRQHSKLASYMLARYWVAGMTQQDEFIFTVYSLSFPLIVQDIVGKRYLRNLYNIH